VQSDSAQDGRLFLRARWMDPTTGRFVSEDPFGGTTKRPSSFHRYLYANESPVNMVDPDGQFGLSDVMSALNALGNLAVQTWVRFRFAVGIGAGLLIKSEPALEELAESTGPRITVVTRLTQFPQIGRTLSVATGPEAEELCAAARTSVGQVGNLYRAQIPEKLIRQMEMNGMLEKSITIMDDAVAQELKFGADATKYVIRFFEQVHD